jgi:hypothetical protein
VPEENSRSPLELCNVADRPNIVCQYSASLDKKAPPPQDHVRLDFLPFRDNRLVDSLSGDRALFDIDGSPATLFQEPDSELDVRLGRVEMRGKLGSIPILQG